ncbi:MAG: class I tRNA ligase family protein, partial [Planctomycetales bacterium]|nr:class I tRNA ligase family protein [Planctomycetales bacterium]
RVSEVIDCWYDSGAMPFAQWGYPHRGTDEFAKAFPADFISEAIDQTRGWFYSQLAISTLLFSEQQTYPHPFRNCIVLGLMLAEWYESKDGKQRYLTEEDAREALGANFVSKTGKMSKQLRNYRSPQEIFDKHGADALRWYFFANQPPWNSIIYSERAIRDSIPEFLLRMWNVLSFFTIYAEIDQFPGLQPSAAGEAGSVAIDQLSQQELAAGQGYRPLPERSELDRWILSELARTTAAVIERMDRYDSYGACQQISELVDALSNWYVRRCRDRYWGAAKADESVDKADAYWTLYEVLLELSKLVAPFVPFVAEAMWQTLTEPLRGQVRSSVHLCDYPRECAEREDSLLADRMHVLREIASLGRSARMDAKLKVRQPLQRVEVSLASDQHMAWLNEHDQIVREELNVKEITYNASNSPYIEYQILPNFKQLGPRLGKQLPALKKHLATADGAQLLGELQATGQLQLDIAGQPLTLDSSDIEVRLKAKSGWTAAQGKFCVVVLSTELTPELQREGYARDMVRLVQDSRKQQNCQFTDRIRIYLVFQDSELAVALEENKEYIVGETLAVQLVCSEPPSGIDLQSFEVAGQAVHIAIEVIKDSV